MGDPRTCVVGALIFLLGCSTSLGQELTLSQAESNVRNHNNIYLVTAAIRENATRFINHVVSTSTGQTFLMYAAYYGEDTVVEELINHGADVNVQRSDGKTALYEATDRYSSSRDVYYYRIVELLLGAGANVSLPEAPEWSPLHRAAYEGSVDIVNALVAANADINRQDLSGETPLMKATYPVENVVKPLLDAGADINIQDLEGETALMHLIRRIYSNSDARYHYKVQLLLDAGANVELPDAPASGPLHEAASRNLPHTVSQLIAAGADINRVDSNGRTPSHEAAYSSHDSLNLLIKAGADINLQDNDGKTPLIIEIERSDSTGLAYLLRANASIELPVSPAQGPLHRACQYNFHYGVKALVEAGADIERVDSTGRTPLMIAAKERKSVLKMMLNLNANVNHEDDNGDTALLLYIDRAYYYTYDGGLLQSLLDAGANVELPAAPKSSPLHHAAGSGLSHAVEALIKSGADVNRLDSEGRTPLIRASSYLRSERNGIVKMLIDAGANVDIQDSEGETALSTSTKRLNYESIIEGIIGLLDASANVHLPSFPANSPLHDAAKAGLVYVVKLLLQAGAEINRTNSQGRTPLMEAAANGRGVVNVLIDAGSEVNAVDNDGNTPLILACKLSRSKSQNVVVDYLLQAGADPIMASSKKTALHYAVDDANNPYIIQRLIESGASVSAEDQNGYTPLLAVPSSYYHNDMQPKMIEILMAFGSDIDHVSDTDGSLMHRLVKQRQLPPINVAMRFCPNLTLMNDVGQTPSDLAQSYGREDIVDALAASHTSYCIYENELYDEGEHVCTSNGALVCLSTCSWEAVDPSLVGCPIVSTLERKKRQASPLEDISSTCTSTSSHDCGEKPEEKPQAEVEVVVNIQ